MSANPVSPDQVTATISSYLSWDHDRLDALHRNACQAVEDGELERAETYHEEFALGLSRHIRLEEDLLFPAFEQATGMIGGPTAMMRHEHLLILQALARMTKALAQGDVAEFAEGRRSLERVLPGHNDKEERVLYPLADRSIAPPRREALVAAMIRG